MQKLAHGAAAENVARPGGIDDLNARRAFHRDFMGRGGGVAALGAQGDVRKRDAIFCQQLPGPLLRRKAPQEFDFFIAVFYNVRLLQAPFHGRLGVRLVFPQGLAQVGVQADEQAVSLCQFNGFAGGGGGGLIGQRQGAKMEHLRISDQAFVDGDHGEGICISLSDGKIKAPFDGRVTGIEPDRPAVRLLGSGGIKLLIKAGIEDNIPNSIFKMK